MISYSAGSPRSKNPMTCSSAPQVNAQTEKHLLDLRPCRADVADRPRDDPERLPRIARGIAERLGVFDEDLDPGPGQGVDLLKHAGEIRPRLDERLRDDRTDERLNEHRAIRGQLVEQSQRLVAEGMQLLRGDVQTPAGARHDRAEAHQRDDDGQGARGVVEPHRVPVRFGRPVAPAQHQDVEIEKKDGNRREVEHSRQADDPLREVLKVGLHHERQQHPPQTGAQGRHRGSGDDQRPAEERPGYERDRRVSGQQGREHPDRDQRRSDEPVPEVVAEH